MTEVILDHEGIYPLREDYHPVTSEVEFLKLAISNSSLQIRGGICEWAKDFYEARQIPYKELTSPISELQTLCFELNKSQAEQIFTTIGSQKFDTIDRPLSIHKILQTISHGSFWETNPSLSHVGEWLLWLIEFKPQEYIQPLLKQMTEIWMTAYQEPEGKAYGVTDADSALELLKNWLGITPGSKYAKWRAFPLNVPEWIMAIARKYWSSQLVESQGSWLDSPESWPIDRALQKNMAEEGFKYFKSRRQGLTRERFDTLSTFLTLRDQRDLQTLLPPMPVSEMPETPDAILNWFLMEYLPYRCWQIDKDDEAALILLNTRARLFEQWLLENYPKALSGSEMKQFISFNKAGMLTRNSNDFVTLFVVMDGLHVGDAHTLLLRIQDFVPRLSLAVDELAFTALPTVTEFCKEALFRCVPPVKVDQAQPIGIIVPETELPILKLSNANLGDVFFWRIQEPDHTYHQRNKYETLLRKVEAELESTAKTIQDIVERVPSKIPLQIIITTDHGRLIGTSRRKYSIPSGMECHGRAAWGRADKDFGLVGYVIEGDIAFLDGGRYGMTYDVAVPLDSDTFFTSDGKGGRDAFIHGGLYPEEVIIPWMGLLRDFVKPNIRIKVGGQATAGKPGTLKIHVTSECNTEITIPFIELEFGNRPEQKMNPGWTIQPLAMELFSLEIEKWPTNLELKKMHCVCHIRQPNGINFNIDGIIEVQSDELYKSENILEDLL
jgi:hypothetical protein